jgi:hypothetical protein
MIDLCWDDECGGSKGDSDSIAGLTFTPFLPGRLSSSKWQKINPDPMTMRSDAMIDKVVITQSKTLCKMQ